MQLRGMSGGCHIRVGWAVDVVRAEANEGSW
jgi:hypothetical protein